MHVIDPCDSGGCALVLSGSDKVQTKINLL